MSHVLLAPDRRGAPRPRIVALPDPSPTALLAEGRAAALIGWLAGHQVRINTTDHVALRLSWGQGEGFAVEWIEHSRVP